MANGKDAFDGLVFEDEKQDAFAGLTFETTPEVKKKEPTNVNPAPSTSDLQTQSTLSSVNGGKDSEPQDLPESYQSNRSNYKDLVGGAKYKLLHGGKPVIGTWDAEQQTFIKDPLLNVTPQVKKDIGFLQAVEAGVNLEAPMETQEEAFGRVAADVDAIKTDAKQKIGNIDYLTSFQPIQKLGELENIKNSTQDKKEREVIDAQINDLRSKKMNDKEFEGIRLDNAENKVYQNIVAPKNSVAFDGDLKKLPKTDLTVGQAYDEIRDDADYIKQAQGEVSGYENMVNQYMVDKLPDEAKQKLEQLKGSNEYEIELQNELVKSQEVENIIPALALGLDRKLDAMMELGSNLGLDDDRLIQKKLADIKEKQLFGKQMKTTRAEIANSIGGMLPDIAAGAVYSPLMLASMASTMPNDYLEQSIAEQQASGEPIDVNKAKQYALSSTVAQTGMLIGAGKLGSHGLQLLEKSTLKRAGELIYEMAKRGTKDAIVFGGLGTVMQNKINKAFDLAENDAYLKQGLHMAVIGGMFALKEGLGQVGKVTKKASNEVDYLASYLPEEFTRKQVEQLVKLGKINPSEGEETLEKLNTYRGIRSQIPSELSMEQMDKIYPMWLEKRRINEMMDGASKEFKNVLSGQVADIDKKILIEAAVPLTGEERAERNNLMQGEGENKPIDKARLKYLNDRKEAVKEKKEKTKSNGTPTTRSETEDVVSAGENKGGETETALPTSEGEKAKVLVDENGDFTDEAKRVADDWIKNADYGDIIAKSEEIRGRFLNGLKKYLSPENINRAKELKRIWDDENMTFPEQQKAKLELDELTKNIPKEELYVRPEEYYEPSEWKKIANKARQANERELENAPKELAPTQTVETPAETKVAETQKEPTPEVAKEETPKDYQVTTEPTELPDGEPAVKVTITKPNGEKVDGGVMEEFEVKQKTDKIIRGMKLSESGKSPKDKTVTEEPVKEEGTFVAPKAGKKEAKNPLIGKEVTFEYEGEQVTGKIDKVKDDGSYSVSDKEGYSYTIKPENAKITATGLDRVKEGWKDVIEGFNNPTGGLALNPKMILGFAKMGHGLIEAGHATVADVVTKIKDWIKANGGFTGFSEKDFDDSAKDIQSKIETDIKQAEDIIRKKIDNATQKQEPKTEGWFQKFKNKIATFSEHIDNPNVHISKLEADINKEYNLQKRKNFVPLGRVFEQNHQGQARTAVNDFKEAVFYSTDANGKKTKFNNTELEAFTKYLFLKRVIDRYEANEKLVAAGKESGRESGNITKSDAEVGLKILKEDYGADVFQKAEEAGVRYQAEMDKVLQRLLDAEIINKEKYDEIKELNDFYAPFNVVHDYTYQTMGRERAPSTTILKKIKGISRNGESVVADVEILTREYEQGNITAPEYYDGATSLLQDALTNGKITQKEYDTEIANLSNAGFSITDIIDQSGQIVHKSVLMAERNKKMLRIAELEKADKNELFFAPVDGFEVKTVGNKTVSVPKPVESVKAPEGMGVISYFKDGKRKFNAINENAAATLNGMNKTELNWAEQAMNDINGLFRFGVITLSPTFQAANFVIDVQRSAALSKHGLLGGKGVGEKSLNAVLYPIQLTESLVHSMLGNFGVTTKMYKDFINSPSFSGGIYDNLFNKQGEVKISTELNPSVKEKVKSGMKYVVEIPSKIGTGLEQSHKILMKNRGEDIEGAGRQGATKWIKESLLRMQKQTNPLKMAEELDNITYEVRNFAGSPDFAASSNTAKYMSLFFQFFSARLKGEATDWRRLLNQDGQSKQEWAASMLQFSSAVIIPQIIMAAYNHRDKESAEQYQSNRELTRNNNLLIPTEDKFEYEGKQLTDYVKIPQRGIAATTNTLINLFFDKVDKKTEGGKFSYAMRQLASNVTPLNLSGRNTREYAESVVANWTPPLKYGYMIVANRDPYWHRELVNSGFGENSDYYKVQNDKMYPYRVTNKFTKPYYIDLSKALYEAGGSGYLTTPIMLQATEQTLLGGVVEQIAYPKENINRRFNRSAEQTPIDKDYKK